MLRSVNKRLDLQSAYRTAERCYRAGIQPSFNLIFGLPEETPDDVRQTLAMVDELGRRNPDAAFFTNIFSPYPGSPIFPEAVRRGVREPGSLEEWAAFYPKIQVLPWLNGAPHARIQRIRDYIRIGYSASHMVIHRSRGLRAPVRRALRGLARWRLRRMRVEWPLEVWALKAWHQLKERRQPALIN